MTALIFLAVGFCAGAATAYVLTRESRSLTDPAPGSISTGSVNRLELVEPPRVSLGDVVAAGIYLTEPDGGDAA